MYIYKYIYIYIYIYILAYYAYCGLCATLGPRDTDPKPFMICRPHTNVFYVLFEV